jgi:hypothetical protein
LVQRGERELPFIAEVRDHYSRRMAVVPWVPFDPVGAERLGQLVNGSRQEPILQGA